MAYAAEGANQLNHAHLKQDKADLLK